jgi:hypothetical protein
VNPAQVEEDHGDLAPVALEWVLGAPRHDQLGELGREEALEPRELLELGHLLAHASLERLVPLRQLARAARILIAQALLLEAGSDARPQEHRLEGLGEIVLAPSSMQRTTLSSWSRAEIMSTGMSRSAGSAFMRRSNS